MSSRPIFYAAALYAAVSFILPVAAAESPAREKCEQSYQPGVGQNGKEVVWVPTPDALVNRMLTMTRTTSSDFVIDLGAGDGKIAIAAAARRLLPDGELLFTTNDRRFVLEADELEGELACEEVTAEITPLDFERRPRQRAWRFTARVSTRTRGGTAPGAGRRSAASSAAGSRRR